MTVHIVTGPPCGGKTTHVREHAQPGDIRIDLDTIANHLTDTTGHEHTPEALKVARAARTAAIDKALAITTVDVWIIHTKPSQKDLDRYAEVNAEIHTIDPGKDIVMRRCKAERPRSSLIAAATWYETTSAASSDANVVTITTGKAKRTKRSQINIDASKLPNPYDIPPLRPLNGTDEKVQEWLRTQPAFMDAVDNAYRRIKNEGATSVTVTCAAGKHRSVAMGELLAQRLEDDGSTVKVDHTVLAQRPSAHDRGYTKRDHTRPRELLIRRHKDGSACFWCGLPMFRKPESNWDKRPLAADHSQAGGAARRMKPDRLLHSFCNSQAGDHARDHERPVVVGCHPRDWGKPSAGDGPMVDAASAFVW